MSAVGLQQAIVRFDRQKNHWSKREQDLGAISSILSTGIKNDLSAEWADEQRSTA